MGSATFPFGYDAQGNIQGGSEWVLRSLGGRERGFRGYESALRLLINMRWAVAGLVPEWYGYC
jgi:hypothetical protein